MNSKSVKEGGMKSMYSKSKRFIASFLAVLMAVCMLPMDVVYATEEPDPGTTKVTLTADMISVGGVAAATDGNVDYTVEYEKDAEPTDPTVTVADCTVDDDYTVGTATYDKTAGTGTITVTPVETSEKITGSAVTVTFKIKEKSTKTTLTATMISVGGVAAAADGNVDYTVEYEKDAEPTDPTVTVADCTVDDDYTVGTATYDKTAKTGTVTVTPVETSEKLTGSAVTVTFKIKEKKASGYPENWKVLDFSKVAVSESKKATYSDGYFTINADNNTTKAGTIKSNKVTVTKDNMNKLGWTVGENTQNVYQTEGTATAKSNTWRGIKFKVSSDARVTVGAISGSADRTVGTQKTSENTDTIANEVKVSTSNLGEYTFYLDDVTAETEYMISAGASIMICYVVVEEDYTISAPEADPADGSKVNANAAVTLTAPDGKDISIYWAYGETAPTATDDKYASADKYSDTNKPSITEEHLKVTAVAVLENADGTVKKASKPVTFTYEITTEALPETINIATPAADKDFGVYDAAQNVSLSSDTKASDDSAVEVDIYYTTDGTNPKTSATAEKYENAIPVNKTGVIKAYAKKDKATDDINTYVASDVATFRYIIKQSEEKTYVMNPANEPFFDLERSNYTPATPETFNVGDDYGVGTDDYFRLMYEGNNKAALRDMNVLTDPQKLGVTSANYYTIANLTASWAAVGLNTLVGELSLDTKAISICGGSIVLASDKVSNAVRIDASAPAKVTVYYSCKNPTTNGKIVVYNATTADDSKLATTSTNVTIDANSNPNTTNSSVGKAEITLAEAGSYYIGFSAQGGIIPYMSVTENKSTSTEDTVAITPTISAGELAKLDGATLYFTATGETDVPVTASGTAVQLKKGVTYSLVAKKDGTVVQTITAKINGNANYEVPNAAADITITVEVESLTANITPTISAEEAAKLDGAKVYFTVADEADKEVVSGTALQLKKGTTYTLVVKKDNVTDETMAAKINGSTEYAVTADATVEITIEAGLTPAERVAITPSISDDDLAKLDGAKVYFTAPGEKLEVTSGTAVNLKKEVKYTLVVEKDGTTVANTTAQIGTSAEYTPTAATTVTITISVTQAPTKPAAPTATVNGHSVANNENVTVMEGATIALTSADSADIYYTDDNSTPDSTSTRYGSSFTVTATKTIKAVAIKDGLSSDVLTFTVTVNSYTYDDEGDEENEDNDWWTEDKDEIKEKNNGKIPAGLWIAGIYSEGYNYTGNKITPYVRVYHNVHLLTEKVDYTISYKNNVNVPTTDAANKQPTIVVKGKGNYVKQATETFKINPRSMGDDSVYIDDMTVLAKKNGGALKPVPTVILSYWVNEDVEKERKLKNKKEFDVKYCTEKEFQDAGYDLDKITGTDSVSAEGSYRIIVTGKGNYSGISSASLEVLKSDAILASKLKVKVGKIAYSKEEASKPGFDGFKPSVEVKAGRDTLTEGTDYTLEFYGNYEAGTARVLISALPKTSGEGENATETYAFYGTRTVTFTITGKPIKSAKVTVKPEALTYSYNYYDGIIGSSDITLEYKGTPMTLGEDYGISWIQNNWAAGKATIYIYGNGEYTGELKKVVKINPRDLSDSSISVTPETISGEFSKGGTRPAITVKYTFDEVAGYSYNLVEGRDYTVTYKSNNNFRKSPSLVIKGKGNFKGSITKTFTFDTKDISEVYFDVPNVVVNRGGKYGSKPVLSDRNGVKEVKLALKKDYTLAYYDMTEKANDPATEADGDTEEKEEGTPISNINKFTDGKAGSVIKVVATAVDGSGYTGKAVRYYTIRENDFSKVKIKVANKEFTGKAVTITADDITITGATLTLQENPDSETDGYYIDPASYVNNVKKGTAKVTLIGTGKYAGSKTVSFKITAKEVKWDRPTTN